MNFINWFLGKKEPPKEDWWRKREKERLHYYLAGVPKQYLPLPGNQRPGYFDSKMDAPGNFCCTAQAGEAVWGGWLDGGYDPDIIEEVLKELGH